MDYDLHLNKNKCSFFKTEIEYLGHTVERNKIRKSPAKVAAIRNMPRPVNVYEVRRILGLITYYSRFVPDFSTISYPLRCLLKKNERWKSPKCEDAFLKLKSELCSDRVLIPFNPAIPIVLTTDASPTGIAVVLSHITEGMERPIAYATRSLTASERNYSQLDREAFALIFVVIHFCNYLYGTHFELVTDNEPISRIFHHKKSLPQMTSARLLRYASFLFDYTVRYKKAEENQNVDCLSRSSSHYSRTSSDQLIGQEVNQIYTETILEISTEVITATSIRNETAKDPELRKISQELQSSPVDSEYTLSDGIIFRQDRIFVPPSLHSTILQEIHQTQLGITSSAPELQSSYVVMSCPAALSTFPILFYRAEG